MRCLAPDLHFFFCCVLGVQSLKASGSAFNAIPRSAFHTNTLQLMSQEKKTALLAEEEKFENYKNEKVQDRTLFLVNNSKICVQKDY